MNQDSSENTGAERVGAPRSSSARRAASDANKRDKGLVRLSLWVGENDVQILEWLTHQHEVTCRHELVAAAIRLLAEMTMKGGRVFWLDGRSGEQANKV